MSEVQWKQFDGEVYVNLESLIEGLDEEPACKKSGLYDVLTSLHIRILKHIQKKKA